MEVESGSLPPALEALVASLEASVTAAEVALQPFTSVSLTALAASLPPLENARLNSLLAFSVTSLLYAHTRASGVDMKEHDVMEEVRAVRNCFARVDETEKLLATRRGETVSKLDVPAAGRFIAAAIGPAGAAASTGSNARGSGGASSMLAPPTASASRAAASSTDSDSEEVEEERGASTTAPAAGAVAGGKRSASGTSSASSRGAPPSKRRAGGTDAGSGDAVQGGAPGAKPKSLDDKRRSTPQPRLSHLNWKEEMSKKFGRA